MNTKSALTLLCALMVGCGGGEGGGGEPGAPGEARVPEAPVEPVEPGGPAAPGVSYATGVLDDSFNGTGKVTTAIGTSGDVANAMAVQSDGKIVAAGYSYNGTYEDFALARYNTNGSLDTGFGTGGIVTTAIGTSHDIANAVAVQPDGKIVAAGGADNTYNNGSGWDFGLARYNTDGTLDPTFDVDGKVTTAIGTSHDIANAVAVQPDGKIVAAGYSHNGTNNDFALARYK